MISLSDNEVLNITNAMAAFSSYTKSPTDDQRALIQRAEQEGLVQIRATYLVSWTELGIHRVRSINPNADTSNSTPQPSQNPQEGSHMVTITLPIFDIQISHAENDKLGASITAKLKERPETPENAEFNAAVDGLESIILAHFCAGIDVSSPAYLEGIETAYHSVGQHFN